MAYDAEKLAEMSGEKGYKKAPEYRLNEVRINGNTGQFYVKMITEEKGEDGKYKKVPLTSPDGLNVIFLKHRRVLAQFRKNEPSLQTNEHNHKDDYVMLFGANEKGRASDLRQKYQGLRTQQIVYAFVPTLNQIVKLVVKGSSLGSEAKQKDVLGYYEYLGTFGKDEHSWQYMTVLKPVKESSTMADYYAIEFIRGEVLSDDRIEKVATMIEEVHNHIKDLDAYYNQKTAQQIVTDVAPPEATADDYPEEEINPEDIPF